MVNIAVKQFIFFVLFLNNKFILYFINLNYHRLCKLMIKEFKINEILDAVNTISKNDKKKSEIKSSIKNNNNFNIDNSNEKLENSNMLVLDQIIE